jgi:tetratricopeptide (TPR) repeat protein
MEDKMAKKTKSIKSPSDYKDVTLEAVADFNKKDFKKALDKFLEMERSNFENPKVHEILVYIYVNLRDLENAQAQYEIYIDLTKKQDPSFIIPQLKNFDELVTDAGNAEELENRYREIMEKDSDLDLHTDLDIAAKLSVIYMSRGEYKKAEDILLNFKNKCKAA